MYLQHNGYDKYHYQLQTHMITDTNENLIIEIQVNDYLITNYEKIVLDIFNVSYF